MEAWSVVTHEGLKTLRNAGSIPAASVSLDTLCCVFIYGYGAAELCGVSTWVGQDK